MIISLKRKTLFIFLSALLAFGGIIAIGVVSVSMPAVALNGMTVVIDAGHGGIDGGVVSLTGKKESEINLEIAQSLGHFLREAGYKVVMTRSNADGLYDPSAKNLKKSDMAARRKIINYAAPDLVISIHQNYYPLKSASGPQVFYAPGSETGKAFSDKMQATLNSALDGDRAAKSGDFYILQCTQYPSMLIECGFLSNPSDEANLLKSSYREKVAYSICTGVRVLLEDQNVG